jgi:hypothetical protein
MTKQKLLRFILLFAIISPVLLFAQSPTHIKKSGRETGIFMGGNFIGIGAKLVSSTPTLLRGGADTITTIKWKNLVGVTQSSNTLTKTAANGWGNAGGATNNKLDTLENGWVNCKITSLATTFAFGLTDKVPDATLDSIRYSVVITSGAISIYSLGSLVGNYGTAALNDSIRIERLGNVLFYLKNDTVFFNQEINAKRPLFADVAIYSNGASVAITTTGKTSVNSHFRSVQNGNWDQLTTWEMSSDSIVWIAATAIPDNNSKSIVVQATDTVIIVYSITIDQTIVNGVLKYGNTTGNTISIANGSGTDFTINGRFEDIGPNNIAWLNSLSTWKMGSSGTLYRTRSTSSDNWRDHYKDSIELIPATANWIIRKTGAENPLLSSGAEMYYPNLVIENTSGSTWTTTGGSRFTGSTDHPNIKGTFDIGGIGTDSVIFVNQNTDTLPIPVGGDLIVRVGSELRNLGTGFEVTGDMTISGSFTVNINVFLGGPNNQTISNVTFTNVGILSVRKPDGWVKLTIPVTVDSLLVLKGGPIICDTTNLLVLDTAAIVIGGSDTSYVHGPVEKIGDTPFTFPLGDTSLVAGPYHPIYITAPGTITDAFIGSYTPLNQTLGDSLQVDTLESISNCEYWSLKRSSGTSSVTPYINWNTNSCNVDDYSNLVVAAWDTTHWVSFGNNGVTVNGEGETGELRGSWGIPFGPIIHILIGVKKPASSCYATLKRELDGGYYLASGKLKFKFDEEYNDTDNKLSFKIYNNLHTTVVSSTTIPTAMQLTSDYGEQWYTLDVLDCNISPAGNLGNGYYILEVENEKKEKWFLRFRNVTNIQCKK